MSGGGNGSEDCDEKGCENGEFQELEGMTIDKKDIVSFWIYRTMKNLQDSDDGHKYMVYRLLEIIDINHYQSKAPTLAGAIMSIAFDYSPTKHKYEANSKAWAIMYAMGHAAIYDQIRRVQRKLVKDNQSKIEKAREEFTAK